jgi:pimeloyl-ACP methyl ester carboxylesterase
MTQGETLWNPIARLGTDWFANRPPARWQPTLGGLQLWADLLIRGPWRIQVHIHSGRHRLVDAWFTQRATGTYADCAAELANLAPVVSNGTSTETVLVLHGLIRTRYSMEIINRHLLDHGFDAHTVAYPSTQAPIETHAQHLSSIIDAIPGTAPIHLVGHSMGGLVARTYLDGNPDSRVRRVVMIGTPNQGAEKARFFEQIGLIPLVGPAAKQLIPGPEGIAAHLSPAVPIDRVEVGIIAGGGPRGRGYSMILPIDNDGVVTVASTKLPGAVDFCLVRGHHSFLPSILAVRTATLRFLRTGCFHRDGHKRPIPANAE